MCRVLGVGTSSFHDWQARRRRPSARSVADAGLTERIRAIHTMSRASYGSPRVWSELRLGEGVRCSRKRVERLMRLAGPPGPAPAQVPWLHSPESGCHPLSGPGQPPVHCGGPRPPLRQRHHRARHRRGEGLSGRGPRRVEPAGRRLVHRRSHRSQAGGRRPADGGVAPAATRGPGHLSFRPRVPRRAQSVPRRVGVQAEDVRGAPGASPPTALRRGDRPVGPSTGSWLGRRGPADATPDGAPPSRTACRLAGRPHPVRAAPAVASLSVRRRGRRRRRRPSWGPSRPGSSWSGTSCSMTPERALVDRRRGDQAVWVSACS